MDLVRYDYPNEGMIIKLEGRNTDIPFYGLSDLLELIDLIAADKEDKVMNVFFYFLDMGDRNSDVSFYSVSDCRSS